MDWRPVQGVPDLSLVDRLQPVTLYYGTQQDQKMDHKKNVTTKSNRGQWRVLTPLIWIERNIHSAAFISISPQRCKGKCGLWLRPLSPYTHKHVATCFFIIRPVVLPLDSAVLAVVALAALYKHDSHFCFISLNKTANSFKWQTIPLNWARLAPTPWSELTAVTSYCVKTPDGKHNFNCINTSNVSLHCQNMTKWTPPFLPHAQRSPVLSLTGHHYPYWFPPTVNSSCLTLLSPCLSSNVTEADLRQKRCRWNSNKLSRGEDRERRCTTLKQSWSIITDSSGFEPLFGHKLRRCSPKSSAAWEILFTV